MNRRDKWLTDDRIAAWAFILGFVGVGGAVALIQGGHDTLGSLIGLSSFAALIFGAVNS